MNISKADAAMLGRRAEQPVKGPGDLIAVFVAGKLVNPLNASAWGWQKRSRLARQWKERVAHAVYDAVQDSRTELIITTVFGSKMPKVVTFLANVFNLFDSDGLQASLKPVRDALVECRVISGDADRDGHTFRYEQKIDRKRRGVEIRVRLAEIIPATAGGEDQG